MTDRFPDLVERVTGLFESDEDFHDLCVEYEVCKKTVARFDADGAPSPAVRNEYAALLLRLECELMRYLAAHPDA